MGPQCAPVRKRASRACKAPTSGGVACALESICGHGRRGAFAGHGWCDRPKSEQQAKVSTDTLCHSGAFKAIKLLLAEKAALDTKDTEGITVLMYAARSGDAKAVTALLENAEARRQSVAALIAERTPEVFEDDGLSLATVANGATALFLACRDGHTAVAEALLDAGAVTDVADALGRTPLIVASLHAHTDTVALLLRRNANIDLADNNGFSALMTVCNLALKTTTYRRSRQRLALPAVAQPAKKLLLCGCTLPYSVISKLWISTL